MNPGFKPHEYRLIYAYSFNCSLERLQYNSSMFMRHFGHKVIHWVGSDVRELMKLRWVDVDYYSTAVLKRISEHWCMTNRDKDILRKMGVDSEVVYPPVDLSNGNGIKRVGISVNDQGLCEQLRKAMPDQAIYHNDLSCDITIHFEDDPQNIIKSICTGNKVISNNPMAGIYYVQAFTNVPELRKMLVHIIRKIRKDDEKPEQETMVSYRGKTNPMKFKEKLERLADKHIQKYGKLEEIVVKGAEA